MELNKYIEHTLLKQDAKKEDIIKLAKEAKEYSFKGCCSLQRNVTTAPRNGVGSNQVLFILTRKG